MALTICGSAQAAFPGKNGRIALANYRGLDEGYDIETVTPAGASPVPIAGSVQHETSPSYSANGKWIAYDLKNDIHKVRANGKRHRRLTHSAGNGNARPDWAPNGKHILFDAAPGPNADLFTIRADGSKRKRILHKPGVPVFDAVYSPDGKQIAYVSFLNDISNIFRLNPRTHQTQPVTAYAAPAFNPAWQPR